MTLSKDSEYMITLTELDCSGDVNKKIAKGSILKVKTMDDYGTFTFTDETYRENCPHLPQTYTSSSIGNILFIPQKIVKFVIAIHQPKERLKFVESKERQDFILSVKPESPVKINIAAFSSSYSEKLRRAIVKYVGLVEDIAPGFYFIVTLLNQDWCEVPTNLNHIIAKITKTQDFLTVIVSAEYIYHQDVRICPPNVDVFHAYKPNYIAPAKILDIAPAMHRNNETVEKLTKQQAYAKRNSSNIGD